VRSPDRDGCRAVAELTGESGWSEDRRTEELADALRSSGRAEHADASDEELRDALDSVFDAVRPTETFSFGSALSQVRTSISRLAADPALREVMWTAVPIAASSGTAASAALPQLGRRASGSRGQVPPANRTGSEP